MRFVNEKPPSTTMPLAGQTDTKITTVEILGNTFAVHVILSFNDTRFFN